MMGRSRTFGAITIVNALPSGIGCAAGIELSAEAEVTLASGGLSDAPRIEIPRESRTPVVEESLRSALSRYHPAPETIARVAVRSDIPVARGLKSSSAVSTAVVLAAARAAGRTPDTLEVARQSAEVGRRVGISATGALDDALAGLETGIVVTNNQRDEVLRRIEIDSDLGVLLYIPSQPHPPSPELLPRFSHEQASGERAARAAMDGDWTKAMEINTQLVERTMGYPYRRLRERLREKGAVACGVSGLGPTLAAIAPVSRLADLLRELPDDGSERRVVSFSGTSGRAEDGA